MKYFKTIDCWKNSTGTCKYFQKNHESFSYGWWLMSCVIKGKIFFNNYHYSNSTSKHQAAVRALLPRIDYYIEAPRGLDNKEAIVRHYGYMIDELQAAIAKPHSHKVKNKERTQLIKQYEKTIKLVNKLFK